MLTEPLEGLKFHICSPPAVVVILDCRASELNGCAARLSLCEAKPWVEAGRKRNSRPWTWQHRRVEESCGDENVAQIDATFPPAVSKAPRRERLASRHDRDRRWPDLEWLSRTQRLNRFTTSDSWARELLWSCSFKKRHAPDHPVELR